MDTTQRINEWLHFESASSTTSPLFAPRRVYNGEIIRRATGADPLPRLPLLPIMLPTRFALPSRCPAHRPNGEGGGGHVVITTATTASPFDTATTDYKSTNSACKIDIVRQPEACRRRGRLRPTTPG